MFTTSYNPMNTPLRNDVCHIDRIPLEMLMAVFRSGMHNELGVPRDALPFPILVSSVNRHWRDIATSSSDLWTDIFFIAKGVPIEVLLKHLKYSRIRLLDVAINFTLYPDKLVLDAIIQQSSRWRSFFAKAESLDDLAVFASVFSKVDIPNAQQVIIWTRRDTIWSRSPINYPFLVGGPALRFLKLRNVSQEFGPSRKNLTYLNIYFWEPNYVEIRDLVIDSPALATLILPDLGRLELDGASENALSIVAPSLRTFAVGLDGVHMSGCRCALRHLFMPELEYLEVEAKGRQDPSHIFLLPSVKRKYLKLRTLRLDSFDLENTDPAFFFAFPNLTHLEIINNYGIAPFPLAHHREFTHLWPFLSCLTLIIDCDGDPLVETFELLYVSLCRRATTGHPISKVRAYKTWYESESMMNRLTPLFSRLQEIVEFEVYYEIDTGLIDDPDQYSRIVPMRSGTSTTKVNK